MELCKPCILGSLLGDRGPGAPSPAILSGALGMSNRGLPALVNNLELLQMETNYLVGSCGNLQRKSGRTMRRLYTIWQSQLEKVKGYLPGAWVPL